MKKKKSCFFGWLHPRALATEREPAGHAGSGGPPRPGAGHRSPAQLSREGPDAKGYQAPTARYLPRPRTVRPTLSWSSPDDAKNDREVFFVVVKNGSKTCGCVSQVHRPGPIEANGPCCSSFSQVYPRIIFKMSRLLHAVSPSPTPALTSSRLTESKLKTSYR